MPNYKLGKIYTIVNDVNDIIYTGSTAVPYLCTRMGGHRVSSKDVTQTSGIYTAMRTIGVDHFHIVLHHVFSCNSKDELVAEEYKTLDALIAAGKPVYNNIIGGKADDATKAKNSAAQKGKKFTDAAKAKMSASKKGNLNNHFSFGSIGLYTDNGNKKWLFQWYEAGTHRRKSFSCNKFGDYGALWRAEQARREIYPEWGNDEDIYADDLGHIELE